MWSAPYTITLDFPTGVSYSFTFNISLVCDKNKIEQTITSNNASYGTLDSYIFYSFPQFPCSIPNCCSNMKYWISRTDNVTDPSSHDIMTKPSVKGDKMISRVNTV